MAETRKLAAILAADVVGFSRLTGADEDRTLARLRALRSDLIDPTIAVYNGRVVKRTGDGVIAEFRSVVEAVRCAIEIQDSMIERNTGLPSERRIEFRIGIHLGDVVEESDGDLMGDGVNIAARLEGVAEPGAVCLSEDAYRQVKSRLDLAISDLGETKLKNIVDPMHIYSLHFGGRVGNDEALREFYKAIELDPNFASAYGMAAWCYIWRRLNGWVVDRAQETSEGARLAQRAVELGKDDAVALSRGGHAFAWFHRDLDNSAAFIDRALALNSNLSAAWNLSGWVRAYRGELDLAVEHQARAMRLSPLDPILYNMQVGTAFAHFLADRYDEASEWATRALREQPNYPAATRILAASKALAGQLSDAQEAMARLRGLDPSLRVSNLGEVYPLRRPEDLAKLADGLRKAGLPD
jgi:class 3 adenylate cyclase